jgi:hypothetical protein
MVFKVRVEGRGLRFAVRYIKECQKLALGQFKLIYSMHKLMITMLTD